MDFAGLSTLEAVLITAVTALAGAIAWGFPKLLKLIEGNAKVIEKNTEAFTALNATFGEIRNEQRDHRQVDLAIRDNLTAIKTILEMRGPA